MNEINYKYIRIAQKIKEFLGEIFAQEIDELEFVSITDIVITKDLGDAKIYVQSLLNDDEEKILMLLKEKTPYLKKRLADEIKMRKIPNLIFKIDNSLENYNKIDNLINNKGD